MAEDLGAHLFGRLSQRLFFTGKVKCMVQRLVFTGVLSDGGCCTGLGAGAPPRETFGGSVELLPEVPTRAVALSRPLRPSAASGAGPTELGGGPSRRLGSAPVAPFPIPPHCAGGNDDIDEDVDILLLLRQLDAEVVAGTGSNWDEVQALASDEGSSEIHLVLRVIVAVYACGSTVGAVAGLCTLASALRATRRRRWRVCRPVLLLAALWCARDVEERSRITDAFKAWRRMCSSTSLAHRRRPAVAASNPTAATRRRRGTGKRIDHKKIDKS